MRTYTVVVVEGSGGSAVARRDPAEQLLRRDIPERHGDMACAAYAELLDSMREAKGENNFSSPNKASI